MTSFSSPSRPDDNTTRTILIDAGEYHEKIIVTRRSPTIFAGITASPSSPLSNRVRIWQSTYVNQSDPTSTLHNCDAVVLSLVPPTSSQHTDFKAYNIDFTQRQILHGTPITQYQLGPSAALCVQSSTNASFYSCSFESYQDTIYIGSGSNAFFYGSIVRGMTDFIYGEGKAWFEKASLLVRACGGGITAWRGDPNNAEDEKVGVYISNSLIDRSSDASREKNLTGQCHLGRPWNADAHAVYLNTWMGDVVSQDGFKVWTRRQSNFVEGRTRFVEYNSSGPGGDMKKRNLTLERVLTDHEAKQIIWRNVFGGAPRWIDAKRLEQQ
ncbi:pectin methylesterase [Pseudozyma hubeiensis SY62]|uniref:pectinesterase n=1 Tax=Pseudozyma hubeiensis (strain SY62) TaxID=1305764 RepID=R9NYQ0_PSEHS|nr:pectin methylesterase [Pseudozyma hubeiensis SY62]GAC93782.1 pectin methylesterase [Pseudozyma hubeiensis SY62]